MNRICRNLTVLLLTVYLSLFTLPGCGGDEGGDGGGGASKDELWERWTVANLQVADRRCSAAAACKPEGLQRRNETLEECKASLADLVSQGARLLKAGPPEVAECIPRLVPTVEGCSEALNFRTDQEVCALFFKEDISLNLTSVSECAELVDPGHKDFKCLAIYYASLRSP